MLTVNLHRIFLLEMWHNIARYSLFSERYTVELRDSDACLSKMSRWLFSPAPSVDRHKGELCEVRINGVRDWSQKEQYPSLA